eukprot:3861742-Rhodomonas_salina.1
MITPSLLSSLSARASESSCSSSHVPCLRARRRSAPPLTSFISGRGGALLLLVSLVPRRCGSFFHNGWRLSQSFRPTFQDLLWAVDVHICSPRLTLCTHCQVPLSQRGPHRVQVQGSKAKVHSEFPQRARLNCRDVPK